MSDHLDMLKAMRGKWEAAWRDTDDADDIEAWVSAAVPEAIDYVAALDDAIATLEGKRLQQDAARIETQRAQYAHLALKYDALEKRLAQVREKVTGLLHDTIQAHRDPTSFDYNECDEAECAWCEDARAVLAILDREGV